MKFMKILEFQMRIMKIMKIIEFHHRIMKIMKVIEFHKRTTKKYENHRIPFDNNENMKIIEVH